MMNAANSLKLYNHFRSSASYRVRIALNLKGLPYEYISIHLLQGEQRAPDFARLRQTDSGKARAGLAGEEVAPTPPLLPADPIARARVRAFALAIACDLHPLNNLRVLQYLTGEMGLASEVKDEWYRHWISEGLAPLEQMMATRSHPERFCFGSEPGLADVFLVPQLSNARRTECDLEAYPALLQIEAHCLAHDAFKRAAPENQPPA